MDQKAIIKKALKNIFESIDDLCNAFPQKSFTIDGRLVGDIGEIIAILDFDINLFDVQQADHDGETSDGRKVQIKATFKDSLTFRTVPDYYLGFKLFKDGHYEVVFNGPGRIIYERYHDRKGIGKQLLSFPINELKRLSESVPDSEQIVVRLAKC